MSQRLRATSGLSACPPRIPRCGAALFAQLQLKLSEAGENTGHQRPEAFDVSMPLRSERSTNPRSYDEAVCPLSG